MKLCGACDRMFENPGYQCPYCLHEPARIEGRLAFAPELAEEGEGFRADYFAPLAKLEAGSFWFRSRNRLIVWALQRYFSQAKNFLEIGCGTGFVLSGVREAEPELSLFGSEVFSAGLSLAAERLPGIELFQMDARQIPFREEFDVIGAFDVIEHIKEDEDVLSQMYRATHKGGGILITVPQHPFLWSQADDVAQHVRRYRSGELADKAKRAGFEVVRLTSFVSLLLPLLVISRFQQRRFNEDYDRTAELKTGSFVDSILQKILTAERTLIKVGVSLPAGGSLLLVARRT